MGRVMRWMVAALVCALACGAAPAIAATKPAPKPPTPAQIKKAVTAAERSPDLWATVNVCTAKGKGGTLGIRGEMPTVGFATRLSMTIQLNAYSTRTKKFVPIIATTALTTVSPGTFTTGLQQDGAVFPFSTGAGRLNATVTFAWALHGKTIGQTARVTTAGHKAAIFGKATRYSAAQCRIGTATTS